MSGCLGVKPQTITKKDWLEEGEKDLALTPHLLEPPHLHPLYEPQANFPPTEPNAERGQTVPPPVNYDFAAMRDNINFLSRSHEDLACFTYYFAAWQGEIMGAMYAHMGLPNFRPPPQPKSRSQPTPHQESRHSGREVEEEDEDEDEDEAMGDEEESEEESEEEDEEESDQEARQVMERRTKLKFDPKSKH